MAAEVQEARHVPPIAPKRLLRSDPPSIPGRGEGPRVGTRGDKTSSTVRQCGAWTEGWAELIKTWRQ
eukprot:2932772-Rhodomonas_salina.1